MRGERQAIGRGFVLIPLVLLTGMVLSGHQDPVGDVHPRITVSGKEFIVTWYDNEPDEPDEPYYHRSYSPDGQPTSPKQELSYSLCWDLFEVHGFDGLVYEQHFGGRTFVFQWQKPEPPETKWQARWLRMLQLQGYHRFGATHQPSDERWWREPVFAQGANLDFPEFTKGSCCLRGAAIAQNRVVLLSTGEPSKAQLKALGRDGVQTYRGTCQQSIWVYGYPKPGKPRIFPIGLCDNPLSPLGVNRLAVVGDQALFVWLEPDPLNLYWASRDQYAYWAEMHKGWPLERTKLKLHLSSLNLVTGKMRTQTLADDVHWNTTLALAVIGNRFLVAYHFGSESYNPLDTEHNPETPRSVIKLIFGDVPPLP